MHTYLHAYAPIHATCLNLRAQHFPFTRPGVLRAVGGVAAGLAAGARRRDLEARAVAGFQPLGTREPLGCGCTAT